MGIHLSPRPCCQRPNRKRTLAAACALALASACGSKPAQSPDAVAEPAAEQGPAGDAPSPEAEASGEPAAAPEADAPAAAEGGDTLSASESLARDFIKKGGRRIGYSESKKSFAYPYEQRRADGFRIDIIFTDEEGRKKDILQVCDYSECAERLDELAKTLLPKLSARLSGDGYESVRGIGWPSGRDELEVSTLGMKLRYKGGRLEGLREGKPKVLLGRVGQRSPELLAIFVLPPEAKRLGVFVKPSGDARGVVQEFHVVKLP